MKLNTFINQYVTALTNGITKLENVFEIQHTLGVL